jgi:hypothetical protein
LPMIRIMITPCTIITLSDADERESKNENPQGYCL